MSAVVCTKCGALYLDQCRCNPVTYGAAVHCVNCLAKDMEIKALREMLSKPHDVDYDEIARRMVKVFFDTPMPSTIHACELDESAAINIAEEVAKQYTLHEVIEVRPGSDPG